jgi:predicted DNA-binding transcriptional regulator AlpA
MASDNLLNTQEVLKRLGISRPTLYSLMDEGKIKPVEKPSYLKRAAKLQFRESDVEKLLSEEPAPTPEEESPENRLAS